jgi:hypothetical protein
MRTQTARSVLLVVAVAALVALAGCSGGGDGTTTAPDDTTDAPTEEITTTADETGMTTTESSSGMETTAEETTTEESSGETTTEEPSDGSDDGNTGDGVSSESIFSEHADAVAAAGSFTANVQIQVNTSQQDASIDSTTMGNIETDTGYQQVDVSSSFLSQTTEVYTSGDETWQRTNSSFGQGPQYDYATAPYEGSVQPVNTSQAATGNFQFGSTELTWSEAGSETVNGIETTRYTANDISSPERASSLIGTNVSSVEDIRFEAFVDGDGIVRRLALDFTGESQQQGEVQQTLTYELTDIGSTTVPTPEWLDEARQQTDS